MHRLRPLNLDSMRTELAAPAGRSHEWRYAHRLHAVLLVGVGHSCYQVASWLGGDARSIERWVQAFDRHGVDGLKSHPGSGRPARLTPAQRAQLALDLSAEPVELGFAQAHWSGKLLARHLERQFGIRLSQRHCQRLLQQRHP